MWHIRRIIILAFAFTSFAAWLPSSYLSSSALSLPSFLSLFQSVTSRPSSISFSWTVISSILARLTECTKITCSSQCLVLASFALPNIGFFCISFLLPLGSSNSEQDSMSTMSSLGLSSFSLISSLLLLCCSSSQGRFLCHNLGFSCSLFWVLKAVFWAASALFGHLESRQHFLHFSLSLFPGLSTPHVLASGAFVVCTLFFALLDIAATFKFSFIE